MENIPSNFNWEETRASYEKYLPFWDFEYQEQSMQYTLVDEFNQSAVT